MYLDGGDVVAIHTLACAARGIYEKHCSMAGIPRFYDHIAATYPEMRQKEIFDALNHARNFFKHPDADGDLAAEIELSDKDNKLMLFLAAYDCSALLTAQTPRLVQAYNAWFMATEPDFSDHACAQGLEARYPGISRGTVDEQRMFGRRFVQDVIAGKI